jgi:hypothetical protein
MVGKDPDEPQVVIWRSGRRSITTPLWMHYRPAVRRMLAKMEWPDDL